MTEADLYRELARAHRDLVMWRNLMALLPYTVHVDHEARRAHERAVALISRIPIQRMPVDLRPLRRVGRR